MKKGRALPKPPFGIKQPTNKNVTEKPPDELYQNCLSEEHQRQILNYYFDSNQFKLWWDVYNYKPGNKKAMRIMVQMGTIDAILRGKYFLPPKDEQSPPIPVLLDKKEMAKAAIGTKMYSSDHKCSPNSSKYKTQFTVIEGDCLEAALWLKGTHHCNPVVLNMASTSHPCGGYRNGAGAQEENLTRRTNLFQCLDDPYVVDPSRSWSYPLPGQEFGGLYSKDVTILRRSEDEGYAWLEKPEKLSIVSVAAYKDPPTEEVNGVLLISKSLVVHIKKKITAICNISLDNGHDSMVLSAFGCGAYGNPPNHMAQIFKEILTTTFAGKFKHVAFAIFNDHNARKAHNPEGNVKPFADVFQCKAIPLSELYAGSNVQEHAQKLPKSEDE